MMRIFLLALLLLAGTPVAGAVNAQTTARDCLHAEAGSTSPRVEAGLPCLPSCDEACGVEAERPNAEGVGVDTPAGDVCVRPDTATWTVTVETASCIQPMFPCFPTEPGCPDAIERCLREGSCPQAREVSCDVDAACEPSSCRRDVPACSFLHLSLPPRGAT